MAVIRNYCLLKVYHQVVTKLTTKIVILMTDLGWTLKRGDDIGQSIRKQNDFLFQEWTHSFVPKEDIYCNEAPGLALVP